MCPGGPLVHEEIRVCCHHVEILKTEPESRQKRSERSNYVCFCRYIKLAIMFSYLSLYVCVLQDLQSPIVFVPTTGILILPASLLKQLCLIAGCGEAGAYASWL